jgi:serine/threonine protein kinase
VENETLIFPEGMSEDAKDFIDKLIRKNPEERIKASEALRHPFLKEIEDDS